MVFVRFGCTFPLVTVSVIALSVCTGVGGCGCPIYNSDVHCFTCHYVESSELGFGCGQHVVLDYVCYVEDGPIVLRYCSVAG